eukprot:2125833-Rhodomonas_salina.2
MTGKRRSSATGCPETKHGDVNAPGEPQGGGNFGKVWTMRPLREEDDDRWDRQACGRERAVSLPGVPRGY